MNTSFSQSPSTRVPDANAIAVQLQGDIAACEALLQLMQDERAALQARDSEALGQIIEDKASHLIKLEQSALTRAEWARNLKSDSPENAWGELLENLQQPELAQQWQQLKQLMDECRVQNEVNGKLLARSQHTFGRLLNIMRGQSDAPALYNQKGSRAQGGSSHNFGEA